MAICSADMYACLHIFRAFESIGLYLVEASGRFQYSPQLWAYFFHFPVSFLKNWFMANSEWASRGRRASIGGRGFGKNLSSVYCRYLSPFLPLLLLLCLVLVLAIHFSAEGSKASSIDSHSHSQSCSITKHIDQFLTIPQPPKSVDCYCL